MSVLSVTFSAIDRMSEALDNMASSGEKMVQKLENAGKTGSDSLEGLGQTATQTAQSMDAASQSADHWTDKIGNYDKGAMEAIYSTEELVEMGYKTADALDNAADSVENFGDESKDAGKDAEEFGNKSGDAIKTLEDLLVTAGIVKALSAIGDAFKECSNASVEFESAVTGIYKTVDGTPEQLAEISDQTKELSLRIPATTTEIAGVAEAAGQLGIATEDIMSFTEVMINLGEATNLSADEAASSLAKFANVTKLDPKEYENLGSTVVALGNNFATTEADIVAMSTRMASAGTLAGLSEPQILALAASLSSVGVEADAGGSAMSTLLSRIQLAVETGTEELQQYAAVSNMTVDEFSQKWGQDAVGALYAFISGLNDTERNGASATAILDEMGISEIRLSNAVKALANNHEGLANAINLADGAWQENTALANEANTRYATLESRMNMAKNAANNLKIAVGDDLNAALSSLLPLGTGIIKGVTTVVEKCPAVTAVITGVVGALGTLVAGVTAYTLYTKYATVVTAAFSAAMDANPILLTATAIVGVTAALVVLISNLDDVTSEYDKLTASSKKQYDEIQALSDEYDKACEVYGENSQQAKELQGELIILQNEFENSKMTVEEFESSLQNTADSIADTASSYDEAVASIDKEYSSVTALIARLEQLTTADDGTAASQAEILAIVEELNKQFPELNLNYEDVINNTQATVEALEEMAMKEYKTEKATEAWNSYKKSMGDIAEAQNKVTVSTESQIAAQERLNALMKSERYQEMQNALENLAPSEAAGRTFAATYGDISAEVSKAQEEVQLWNKELEESKEKLDKAKTKSEEYLNAYMEASGITAEMKNATEDASGAIENAAYQVQILAQSYQDAYIAAEASFSGQFGLFDTAKADMESTVSAAQQALDSQLSFWQTYADNVNTLRSVSAAYLGVTQENYDAIMAYAQSGTEEAAGFAQSLANAVNSGNTEAITKLADTVGQVKAAREQAAGEVAAWRTDFDNKTDDIVQKMQTTMQDLNMSEEATAAAASTMSAYASSITSAGSKAVSAAQSIAAQVKAALNVNANVNVGTTTGTGKGYATGTTYATQGFHLVGEQGPEIVAFEGGETVYDAAETEKILSSTRPTPLHTNVPESVEGQQIQRISTGEKRIVLAIEGGGEIKVPAGVDKETVIQLITTNLKPALLNILQEEVYEEGDGSYAY